MRKVKLIFTEKNQKPPKVINQPQQLRGAPVVRSVPINKNKKRCPESPALRNAPTNKKVANVA